MKAKLPSKQAMTPAISPTTLPTPSEPTTAPLSQRSIAESKDGSKDGGSSNSERTNMNNTATNTAATTATVCPSPSKLRRKVSVEDALQNVASIQRLVEYFVTISCHPRMSVEQQQQQRGPSSPSSPAPQSPKVNASSRPEMPRGVSAPIPSSVEPDESRQRSFSGKVSSVFRKAKSSTEHGLVTASFSQDGSSSQLDETREETLPPPKPRGTWKRDEDNVNDGNIRMPQDDNYDEFNFQPKITSRYPLSDHQDNPLNPMVTQFCHPVGDVVFPTREYLMPRVHYFVLTNDKGRKIYGTCLTVYEEYDPPSDAPLQAQHLVHSDSGERDIEITVDNEKSTLYLPRCLCLLSMWPYITAFREYLAQIYRLATSTNCMTVPLERYIMNICMEIPAPPPGAFEVQINILDSVIRFWSPPAKLPIAYVALPYQVLFDCLDLDNILHLWYCLTMEQKVLLVSSQYSNLTVCSEILCSLLYPMKWSHLYVPLLPRFLCPMLDAPVPYLCGVTRDNWLHVQQFVSEDTIVVDLDRNNVMFGAKTPQLPPLPGKKWKKLRSSLEDIAGHLFWRTRGLEREYQAFRSHRLDTRSFKEAARRKGEVRWNEKLVTFDQAFDLQFTPDSENIQTDLGVETEQNQWDLVQESFLRFFVALFKDYRRFLDNPDGGAAPSLGPDSDGRMQWNQRRSFDRDGFIGSQKTEYVAYLSHVTLTQQFDDFITKRLYSPEMPDIIFFDQSIEAKLNRSRLKLRKVDTPFLQSAKAHKVLTKFIAVEPCAVDLDVKTPFIYKQWPEKFNQQLFGMPRPIPTIITAEFDRQAALISRLRSTQEPGAVESNHLFDFYGSDYDTSPEGMAFTVFFYAYSAVIGREWQAFQHKQRELQAMADLDAGKDHSDVQEGVGSDPVTQTESVELEIVDPDTLSDTYLGLCDACPSGAAAVNDALVYVTTSPCPRQIDEFNAQAQIAFEAISGLANSPSTFLQGPTSSLLDKDNGFAEYEEARAVAVAQLHLAFDTLKNMEMRGLLSDPDVFKSLMEACGRCGDTKRALELIEMMKRDGLAADQEVLSCFMAAFAHNDDDLGDDTSSERFGSVRRQRSSDAYSSFLKKNLQSMTRDTGKDAQPTTPVSDSDADSCPSDHVSNSGSETTPSPIGAMGSIPVGSAILDWFYPRELNSNMKARRRKRRRRRTKMMADREGPLTDRLSKQIVLGESLLDFLYPDLKIDTDGDSCPQCSNSMTRNNVIAGWRPRAFQDVTTRCPQCQHRFVPRFSISCSAPTFEGSQGVGTPLYCEFLSPWVLRKELSHVIDGDKGIDLILDPEWRSGQQVGSTIWWNLVALFKHYKLPFSFLLQGSFQNRLISPIPQD